MRNSIKLLLMALAVVFIFGNLVLNQNIQQKPIPQHKFPNVNQSIHLDKDKQKVRSVPQNMTQGYDVFENDRIAVYRFGQESDITNKQTGQTIRVNHVGVVHNINGKKAGVAPLVGDAIAEGIKLVSGDEITLIGIEPTFKVLAAYPNPRTNRDKIIINKGTNTLYFYRKGELYKSYPVATGKDPLYTPEGVFKIANKIENQGQELKPQLGEYWMGLSVPYNKDNRAAKDARAPVGSKYGIHGTNEPDSIGKYVSGGCVRMDNKQVAELFRLVQVNTTVEIRHR